MRDGVFARGRYVVAGKIVLQTLPGAAPPEPDHLRHAGAYSALLGQYPEWLAENAARAVELGSYGVDLSCGCRRSW